MKLSLPLLICSIFASCVFAQAQSDDIQLSKTITSKNIDFSDFNKIDVSEDFKVYIRFSDTEESVKIEANENLHDLIKVTKKDGSLKISTKSYSTIESSENNQVEEVLNAYITMKDLVKVKGEEDVEITLEDKLNTNSLAIKLDEDCILKGHIEVQNLDINLDEDASLDIKGSAASMQVKANEDSFIEGFDLIVGNLKIDLKEDSEAKLTVNGNIDLKASGDSYFHHKGEGSFTSKKLSGDSEVKSRNIR